MVSGQKAARDGMRRWTERNPVFAKSCRKAADHKSKAKNRAQINKRNRDNRNGENLLRDIRKKHCEDTKNDPESLSPDFMDIILELDSNDYELLVSHANIHR